MSVKKTAAVLAHMDQRKASRLLAFLEEKDEKLARQVRNEMMLFADLLLVDERGLQNLLREVEQESLVTALKGVDWPLVEKILQNLSPRAAERLREDMALAGPKRVKDVEAAQQTILQTAKELQSRGALWFVGKGDTGDLIY